MGFENMVTTASQGVAASVKDYYDVTLQRNLQPKLVHARDAQKVPLPQGNGKFARFRKPVKLAAVTTPLSEGVTPEGQKLELTDMRAMVKPYGGHIQMTDEADFTLLDSMQKVSADLLAEQARLTIDTVLRDAYNAGANVFYPDGLTGREQITDADVICAPLLKKVVRMMEHNSVPKFSDGYYHAIIGPYTKYDLTDDPLWMDVAKYQNTEKMEKYEVGKMLGIKFFETPNAKSFSAAPYLFGTTASLAVAALDVGARKLTITAQHALITPDVARQLAGTLVDLKNTHTNESNCTQDTLCIERVEPSDGAHAYIYLRWLPAADVLAKIAASGYTTTLVPSGGGKDGAVVHSTLIYGQDAFGTISLGGNGDNVQTIINPPGSSGGLDPLAQRASVAWKVRGFCGVILDDVRVCRIEHGVSG